MILDEEKRRRREQRDTIMDRARAVMRLRTSNAPMKDLQAAQAAYSDAVNASIAGLQRTPSLSRQGAKP